MEKEQNEKRKDEENDIEKLEEKKVEEKEEKKVEEKIEEKTPRQLIKELSVKIKDIVEYKNGIPCAKGNMHTRGVTKIIDGHAIDKDSWMKTMPLGEFSSFYLRNFSDVTGDHREHTMLLEIFSALPDNNIDIVAPKEFPVLSTGLKAPLSHEKKQIFINLIGSIDLLCHDSKENTFVIADVKTVPSKQDSELFRLVLKQKYAIQMTLYANTLERMASEHGIKLRVGYFVIIGVDAMRLRVGMWKIERNDNYWLDLKASSKYYHPIVLSYKEPEKKKEESKEPKEPKEILPKKEDNNAK